MFSEHFGLSAFREAVDGSVCGVCVIPQDCALRNSQLFCSHFLQALCYGLICVPLNSRVEVLTLNLAKCDLTWK